MYCTAHRSCRDCVFLLASRLSHVAVLKANIPNPATELPPPLLEQELNRVPNPATPDSTLEVLPD